MNERNDALTRSAHDTRTANTTGGPHGPWAHVAPAQWNDWRWQQTHRLRRADQLADTIGLSPEERHAFEACADAFDVAITPYYASLMGPPGSGCPVRAQALPHAAELLTFDFEREDPLAEEAHMPVPGITHRYPDRVLFYVTHNCPVYCRHCTRKRKVADPTSMASRTQIDEAIAYIARTPTVRDVLLSGGDPLTLSDDRLAEIFDRLSAIPHVEVMRLGTRNPVTLPQRITPALVETLRRARPLYVHTHFNHPSECTEAAGEALRMLAESGCVLGNQMVLLRGVNDDAETVLTLNRWLLRHSCRPYYMLQADMAQGISHFRTPLQTGIDIVDHLRGRISGMGVPHFVIDLPGGGGKISLTPEYEVRREGNRVWFRNGFEETYVFDDVGVTDAASKKVP